uniref:Uncharacterized protein n=1 Tax=Picea glauca TaxID=3330 RepID=A0A101M1B7_PICGL|nr:hypothetical protein ABT39_MTgene3775 [Picea glauca]
MISTLWLYHIGNLHIQGPFSQLGSLIEPFMHMFTHLPSEFFSMMRWKLIHCIAFLSFIVNTLHLVVLANLRSLFRP